MLRHHRDVWDPIRVTHLGQRSYDRTTKAGHMTAFDQIIIALPRPCETGAAHIWVPAFPTELVRGLKAHGTTTGMSAGGASG